MCEVIWIYPSLIINCVARLGHYEFTITFNFFDIGKQAHRIVCWKGDDSLIQKILTNFKLIKFRYILIRRRGQRGVLITSIYEKNVCCEKLSLGRCNLSETLRAPSPPRCYVPEKWHLITYVSWNEFTL